MKPTFDLLNPERVERIVEDALQTLETVGMFVENDDALELLAGAGVTMDNKRAFIPEATVRMALDTAPSTIELWSRDGTTSLQLGGDNVCFDPGSTALYILDPQTGRRRTPTHQDCVHLAWVTQACKHVEAQATAIIPANVPNVLADRYRLFVALANSTKPVVTGTFLTEAFAVMKEMLVVIRGSEQALKDKPLCIFDCAPTPPLKWSDLTCQALVDCARAGIPAELVSMPMAGATSPVTLRDVVVQHTAESMCGVVIHQLASPGAPIIYGGSPSALDMRHGTTPMGAIETMMIDVAYARVGKHLGLPTHAYMALSDAKCVDWQAGMETGVGAVLAALGGINMVSGPGMLDFESCQSLEKLLLDDQACGMALRLVRGISAGAQGEACALIGAVVESGHFLSHPHTRANFKKELFIPNDLITRGSYGRWEQGGAQSAFAAAQEKVRTLVAKGNPAPLETDLQKALTELMAAEARRVGADSVPLLD